MSNKLIHAFTAPGADAPAYINISRMVDGSTRVVVRGAMYSNGMSGAEEITLSDADWRSLVQSILSDGDSAYDRGRRDMLNALLALNPEVARQLHDGKFEEGTKFTNTDGKLPFDVVFWVTAVADQLGIQPREENGPT